jgi:hypothetical protein
MYESPAMDDLGAASELIHASQGPRYDGGATIFSFGLISSQLEEE